MDFNKLIVDGKVLQRRRHISTQIFYLGNQNYHKVIKDIYVAIKEWKFHLVNVVTFCLEIRMRHGYKC
jgi:hypothetical protein